MHAMMLSDISFVTTLLLFYVAKPTSTLTLTMLSTTVATSKMERKLPTLRSIDSTLSVLSPSSLSSENIDKRISKMAERAHNGTPFTEEEIRDIVNGLKNLSPIVDTAKQGVNGEDSSVIDFASLRDLLRSVAHLSHKNWEVTSKNSDLLSETLSIGGASPRSSCTLTDNDRQLLERILKDGGWDGALQNSRNRSQQAANGDNKSWAVLVTGVNGIRKTTSIYQPWFSQLLKEALIEPDSLSSSNKRQKVQDMTSTTSSSKPYLDDLPDGSNSFFRQLDHIICTLCNEEFAILYAWAASTLPKAEEGEENDSLPSDEIVEKYSNYKAAIFTRYRTLSELLGASLLKQAQQVNINCMLETSGRDVAMFHYVDHFFGDNKNYNKLALHFTINDLSCAKQSVDQRMINEIKAGAKAIENCDVYDIIYTNQGGPYGSKVLDSIEKDSDRVWKSEVMTGNVGKDWYKATIAINAHPTKAWTAQPIRPDGSLGTEYTFERR